MSAVYQTTFVTYCIVESKQKVGNDEQIIYGVKGTDGIVTVQLLALSYDYGRINQLVGKMNKCQFALCFFNDVVCSFFKNYYDVEI